MSRFIRYFFQGLLLIVPLGLTFFVLYKLVKFFMQLFARFDTLVHPYADPVIFIVLGIIAIVVIGWLTSQYISGFLLRSLEKMLEQAPIIKLIYSWIKDFLAAFIGNKKRFNRPVLVLTNPQAGIREMGFITQDDLSDLHLGKEDIAVYMPMSYAITGKLIIVKREQVSALDIPPADAMKFIVSGGVTDID